MSGIFISYRREDSSGWTGRLAADLRERFGKENVFIDIDAINPGFVYQKTIEERISSSKVALVVIGPRWLTADDSKGRRRIDDPEDVVRAEVRSVLARDILVIPAHGNSDLSR